jgi:hypothetical protein
MAAPLVRPYQQLKLFSNVSSAEQEVRTQIAANKILEAKVLLEAKTAPYTTPTSQNTLFRLPREIRDKVYDYAFGTTPLILKPGGLLILTTCGNPKSGYQNSDRDDIANFELESNYRTRSSNMAPQQQADLLGSARSSRQPAHLHRRR